ncbi:MAG: DNA primase [Bacteroidales bacterium]
MIKPEIIQQIFDTAQVEEVVGDFVQLKRRGTNMIGLCPFHNEKTPSFSVSPGKGIYKCFGCGKGGNSVNFIMEHEHYSYPEALRYLANKYNIDIEEEELSDEEVKSLSERESLFHVTELASKFYKDQLLFTSKGKAIGRSYFRERGFSDVTIEKFRLGYSPDEWSAFTQHATQQGFSMDIVAKAGLCIVKDSQKFYDRFRERVMFPIQNLTGKVIGFGGRILNKEKSKAKYINSPETEIYNKSRVLYGIYQSKNQIIRENECLLVEGYTDVISLHQNGIENVVSSSGTSLTEDQIKLIKRFSNNITILYDGDAAGIKASFRGIDMILEQGMNVRVVLFPDGEDPDSFAQKTPVHELKAFIDKAKQDFISFKTQLLLSEASNDPVKRAEISKDIVKSISAVPDIIIRTEYIKQCSGIMQIPERTLTIETNRLLRENSFKQKKSRGAQSTVLNPLPPEEESVEQQTDSSTIGKGNVFYQEKEIIRLLLNYGHETHPFPYIDENGEEKEEEIEVASFIIGDLENDEIQFFDHSCRQIYQEYINQIQEGSIPKSNFFTTHENKQIRLTAINALATKDMLSEKWESKLGIHVNTEKELLVDIIIKSILCLKQKNLRIQLDQIELKLKDCKDFDEIMVLQKDHMDLKKILDEISLILNRPFSS